MIKKENVLNPQTRMYEVIDMMRFPLIVLVVYSHMIGFDLPKVTLAMDGNSIYVFISELISHNIARISVRFYFLVSGYFFFYKLKDWEWSTFSNQLKKKGRTILVPYVFWNILTVLISFIHGFIFYYHGTDIPNSTHSLYDIFWNPANYPLWYMRDLMCMMLLSPLIYFLIHWLKHWFILGLTFLFFCNFESGIAGFSGSAITFFSIGGYLAIQNRNLLELCSKVRVSATILSVVFLFLAVFNNHNLYRPYLINIFILLGVVTAINLFNYLYRYDRFKQFLISLSASTFFIYSLHEVYVINWLKGGFSRLSIADSPWGKLAGYFIIPWVCIAVCMLIFWATKKFIPSFYMMISGKRNSPHVKSLYRVSSFL